jgi:Flp pilus assembly protein TadD
MSRRPLHSLCLAACLFATGCGTSGDEANVSAAVEPTLRAAAMTAEANNDYKGAAQHWRTLYQARPEDKGVALSLAHALRLSGQPQMGADIMQLALARQGRDGDFLAELGKDYLADQRLGLALKALEEARTLHPNRWDVPSAMGVCFDLQGKYAEAAAAYADALALLPDNPQVLNNLGLSQALAGKLDDGIATLRQANDLPGANVQVRQNLAMLMALKGDPAAAESLAARDLPPEMARINNEIFRRLSRQSRH